MRVLVVPALLALWAAPGAHAQTVFETASVKPVKDPHGKPLDFRIQPGGRLEVSNQDVLLLIRQAFSLQYYQVTGGPGWLKDERYDIVAKADGEPTRPQMMEALQKLLADRFGLQWHWDEREGKTYALVVGKGDPKLGPGTGSRPFIGLMRNTPLDREGTNYTFDAKRATMAMLADRLEGQMRAPVRDETGLTGEYDFKLNFATDESGVPIPMALEDQLGLKLESRKGTVRTLVIDRAEKPTEN
jgi:uncharacterized protein (TIGR03435 family)